MKKRIMITLALALLMAGNMTVPARQADAKSIQDTAATQAGPPVGMGKRPHRRLLAMRRHFARKLGLTDAQRAEIRSIVDQERSNLIPLRQELAANRRELHNVIHSGPFDESQARLVADKQAKVFADLMVARARVRSKIYAVLTPEQRQKADQLRERRFERMHEWVQG